MLQVKAHVIHSSIFGGEKKFNKVTGKFFSPLPSTLNVTPVSDEHCSQDGSWTASLDIFFILASGAAAAQGLGGTAHRRFRVDQLRAIGVRFVPAVPVCCVGEKLEGGMGQCSAGKE